MVELYNSHGYHLHSSDIERMNCQELRVYTLKLREQMQREEIHEREQTERKQRGTAGYGIPIAIISGMMLFASFFWPYEEMINAFRTFAVIGLITGIVWSRSGNDPVTRYDSESRERDQEILRIWSEKVREAEKKLK